MTAPGYRDKTQADLEKVKMALAEAGHPTDGLYLSDDVDLVDIHFPLDTPPEALWKAAAIIGLQSMCLECLRAQVRNPFFSQIQGCLNIEPGTEDCGLERW